MTDNWPFHCTYSMERENWHGGRSIAVEIVLLFEGEGRERGWTRPRVFSPGSNRQKPLKRAENAVELMRRELVHQRYGKSRLAVSGDSFWLKSNYESLCGSLLFITVLRYCPSPFLRFSLYTRRYTREISPRWFNWKKCCSSDGLERIARVEQIEFLSFINQISKKKEVESSRICEALLG